MPNKRYAQNSDDTRRKVRKFHHTTHPVAGEKPSQTDTIDWAKETLGINVSLSQISKWASNLFKHLNESQNLSLPTSKRHY
ncbi:hypothetical protein K3495_g11199 [Podosphaera aphanis]|nr:hypothetical protein K3495_g11199 [Podosphaera aphanis]